MPRSKKEEGTLTSQFPYLINVPESWNGIVINDLDAVANKDGKLAAYLLDHGYAYTGTGRHPERMTRHDPPAELEAQVAVIKMVKEKFGQPGSTKPSRSATTIRQCPTTFKAYGHSGTEERGERPSRG